MQKSIRFFIMIFPAFFALVNPVSTIAKPACIQKTRAAPIKNHTPKILLFTNSVNSIDIVISSFLFYDLVMRKAPSFLGSAPLH